MRASLRMPTNLRIGLSSTFTRAALAFTLWTSAHAVQAQATPAPTSPPAPASQVAPPPAPPGAQPAPPPATAYPAYPAQPSAAPAAPPGYQPQPSPLYYQPVPPPLYQPPPGMAWQPRPRPSKALMITGISILGGAYLIATTVGAAWIDDCNDEEDSYYDCRDYEDAAPWLFVPIVGPFIGMSHLEEDGEWFLWMLGMVEVVGTGLMIGGIIRYKNTKRAAEANSFSRWELPGGRSLSLDVSTRARSIGPRLTFDF